MLRNNFLLLLLEQLHVVVSVNEEAQLERPRVGGNVCAVEDCDPYTGEGKAKFSLEQARKAQGGVEV